MNHTLIETLKTGFLVWQRKYECILFIYFHFSELALVYDKVICGKDIFREKPLRSHLRRSIKEERAEKEKKANQKPVRIRQAALTPSDDLGMKKF